MEAVNGSRLSAFKDSLLDAQSRLMADIYPRMPIHHPDRRVAVNRFVHFVVDALAEVAADGEEIKRFWKVLNSGILAMSPGIINASEVIGLIVQEQSTRLGVHIAAERGMAQYDAFSPLANGKDDLLSAVARGKIIEHLRQRAGDEIVAGSDASVAVFAEAPEGPATDVE